MAQLELAVIRERVIAGQDYTMTHGTKSGKSIERPKVICRRDPIVEMREQGCSC